MRRALSLSLGLAILLAATLLPKWLATSVRAESDELRLVHDMAAVLSRDGWTTRVLRYRIYVLVVASREDCRLVAANALPTGYLRTRFARLTEHVGPVAYHYGGPVSSFPRGTPVVADHAQRWLYALGFDFPLTPIIAVATPPRCTPPAATWQDLRIWPAPARPRASPSAPGRS